MYLIVVKNNKEQNPLLMQHPESFATIRAYAPQESSELPRHISQGGLTTGSTLPSSIVPCFIPESFVFIFLHSSLII
jgi:hypothetical protein